ncbi:hypothetical protein ULMA_30730 [Patiriisocius marinus]|uniref:CshA domain-containing protein n=1 Tax=Patiriisocius marinus TaxID=1397112 RepID=A0A5J4ISH7_9FLAO|nr:Ig-like domain-containing protein [Patiriisocius marinus]GER60965.1 hypothetical protein ULMA_30730 [Patiriisocius marinus]
MGKITLPFVLRNKLTSMVILGKRSFLLLLLTTLSFVTSIFAQDYANSDFEVLYQPSSSTATPIDPDVGIGSGNEAFNEIGITALGSGTNSVQVTINLPPGVTYITGTASIVGQSTSAAGAYTIADVMPVNSTNPVFEINKGAAAVNWGVGEFVNFIFQRTANCLAVEHSEAEGTFKDYVALSYSGGLGSGEDTNPNSGTYNLVAPSLQVDGPILSLPAVVGGVHEREVVDINAGNSGVVEAYHEVFLGDDILNYQLFYLDLTTPLTPDDPNANPLVFRFNMTDPNMAFGTGNGMFENGDGIFDDGEDLVFTERFSLASCGNSTADTNVTHKSGWDCFLSDPVVGSVLFGGDLPTLVFNVVDNPRELCGSNTVRVEITNTGVGPAAWAKDVRLSFGLGSNNQLLNIDYNNNNRWSSGYYDQKIFTNFRIGGTDVSGNISGWQPVSAAYQPSGDTQMLAEDTLTADPDGPNAGFSNLDNDIYFDDIAPGHTVILEYDITFVDDDQFMCSSGDDRLQDWEHIYLNAIARTQCDVSRISGTDLGYGNLARDYQVPTLREQDTDTTDGAVFEVAINPYFINAGTDYKHNGHAILNTNADNEMVVSIEVPAGVVLAPGADSAFSQDPVSGVVTYTTTDLQEGYSNRLGGAGTTDKFVRFPLIAYCGVTNPIVIPYKTTYNWYDSLGNICKTNEVHCDNFLPILLHNCDPCQGPNITAFDSYRITPGYTDDTMMSLVNLDPAIHELDIYLAGDDMRVEAEGFMNSSAGGIVGDDLHFRQKYDLPDASATHLGQETISFIEGQVYFKDASTGLTTAVTTLDPPVIIPDPTPGAVNSFIADFDFSNAITTLDSGTVDNNDEFFVLMDWHFKVDTYYADNYNVMGFRGRFFTIEPTHPNANTTTGELTCDDWGDSVEFTRPFMRTAGKNEVFANCDELEAIDYNNYIRGSVGHVHPGEYRPFNAIKQIDYFVPDGVRVLDASQSTSVGTYRASDGDLLLVQQDDNHWRATPVAGSDYRDTDQRATASYRTTLTLKGTCELEEATTMDVFTTMDLYSWAHNVYADPSKYGEDLSRIQNVVFTDDGLDSNDQINAAGNTDAGVEVTLNYSPPTYNFQPLVGSSTDGYGPEAFFDLQIVNTSGSTIDYHWIKVPAGVITVTNAYLDVNADGTGGGTPVNNISDIFIDSAGNSYVNVGSVAVGATKNIRIAGSYDTCEVNVVDFYLGYDCDAYPADYETATDFCYKEIATISLIPASALVQQEIVVQPISAVDNCTPFEITLEYNSGLNGTVVDFIATLEPFGGTSALDIISVEVQYPLATLPWNDITGTVVDNGTTYVVDISNPAMDEYGGLPGTGAVGSSTTERKAQLRFMLQTTCDYQSNAPIGFKINGNAACGEPASGDNARVLSNGITIDGLQSPYRAFPEVTIADPIDGCGANFLVVDKSTIKNINGSPAAVTGTEDFAKVTIPAGLSYVPGTLQNTGGGTHPMMISSEMTNELIVQYPQGMMDDDSIEFSFEVTPINGVCSDAASVEVSNYIESSGSNCATNGGVSCSEAIIQTGSKVQDVAIRKPSPATLNSSDAVLTETASAFAYVLASITIENTGDLDMPAGAEYDFYCADASGNPVGSSIYTGNLVGAIPANGSLTEAIQFNGSEGCDETTGIVFVMEPSDANCMCGPTQIPMALLRTPIQAMPDDFVTAIDQSIHISLFGINDGFGDDHDDEDILGEGNTVVSSYTQPANGTVIVDPDGTMHFTPAPGWSGETSFEYTITDEDGNTSTTTVTIRIPMGPEAVDDEDLLNPAGPVTMDTLIGDNDIADTIADPSNAIDPATVNFVDPNATDSNGDGFNDTLVVPGEGTWTVSLTGEVMFVPVTGFTADPTPINYVVNDLGGLTSVNEATLTITYVKVPPVPQDDYDLDNVAGSNVTIDLFANNQDPNNPNPLIDSDADGTVDITSVSLIIPSGATGITVVDGNVTGFDVPGEGTWSLNPFNGEVTFIPLSTFTGNPTPIDYTIRDNDGNINLPGDNATITITYLCDLDAPTSPDVTPMFCVSDGSTLSDLVVDNIPAGASLVWYDSSGNVLSNTTALSNGVMYYAGFAEAAPSTCMSDVADRLQFTVTVSPEPEDPNGDTLQEFCESDMATLTLEDLEVTTDGQTLTLNYYDTLADYNADPKVPLPSTTLLTALTDDLVVISQTNAAGCESIDLLTVIVSFVPTANPGTDATVTATCDPVDLFAALGTADSGGTWSPNLIGGMFDPTVNPSGVYTYTINGDAPCSDVSAAVTVTNDWPTSDCDGDGVTNEQEIIDGTDPTEVCDFVDTNMTLPPSAEWNMLDCDGDGDSNATDSEPNNPCVFTAGSTADTSNPVWQAADCDGDGETNGFENDNGSDPTDPCSISGLPTIPLAGDPNYSVWAAADCDGDGDPNGTDTEPYNPCVFAVGSTADTSNAIWQAADCDGDGETNGFEDTNGSDPTDPCSVSGVPTAPRPSDPNYVVWAAADCDGDGETNGTEILNGTNPFNPCSVTNGTVQVDPAMPGTPEQTAYDIWAAEDCDGDGTSNGTDPAPYNPCVDDGTIGDEDRLNPIWQAADCDGDGDPNGTDVAPYDPCVFAAGSVADTSNPIWQAADCDGDGDPNSTDPDISNPCVFTAGSVPDTTSAIWQPQIVMETERPTEQR